MEIGWRHYLRNATRALSIPAASDRGFVVAGVQAHGISQSRPVLLDYRASRTVGPEEFSLARVVTDASSPAALDDEHYAALHLHRGDGHQVCVFGASADHHHVGPLPGCGKIVYHPTIGGVAGLVPIASVDPFLDAQVDNINASLARRRIRGWRLALVRIGSGEVSELALAQHGPLLIGAVFTRQTPWSWLVFAGLIAIAVAVYAQVAARLGHLENAAVALP